MSAERSTWNAAIRASEALARDYAREHGIVLHGDRPTVYGPVAQPGSVYRRTWRSGGTVLFAEVVEVSS